MKKIYNYVMLLFLASCGQPTISNKDIDINNNIEVSNKINDNIVSSKTSKHVNIPGTRLYIVPPKDFVLSYSFIGFQKGENTLINIIDLVGGNFYTNAATFSKSEFENKGARVFDYKELKVNGYPAKYLFMQGDATAKSYALVFGDTTFSATIMAVFPVTDEQTGLDILNSLNTIWYDTNKKIDPFEAANFGLDESVSTFKFFRCNSNVYLYTLNGKERKDIDIEPIFTVLQIPKDNSMTSKSIADMMLAKFQQSGLTNPIIKNTSSEQINGYETFQMEVSGKMKNKNTILYYCVVSSGDKAIVMQGLIPNSNKDDLKEIKKLAWTVNVR
jgi:hypothetical protein